AVDVETLELAHGGCCVLGQLHGEFRIGLGRTSIFNLTSAPRSSLSPVDLGFLCVQGASREAQDRDYDLLNRAWQEEITKRQVSAQPAIPAVQRLLDPSAARPEPEMA
ncbi:MAG TPA: hypothetical protein VFG50_05660, partial [Rhodothermales bacterium]|nr:hypothetical protein [Rhodothermales bacterium]